MTHRPRTGRSRAIRDYLRQHPGSTVTELQLALGEPKDRIWDVLQKMLKRGIVLANGCKPRTYLLGRPVDYELPLTEAEREAHRQRRAKRRHAPRKDYTFRTDHNPAPARVVQAAQTVEDFIAAGGRVERILSSWERAA